MIAAEWAAKRRVTVEVLRYRPEQDADPSLQAYDIPYTEDMSVLQALQHIKDHIDGTPVVPLVVPDGDLRQLRDDDRRQAAACLPDLPARLSSPARCASSRSSTFRSSATSW